MPEWLVAVIAGFIVLNAVIGMVTYVTLQIGRAHV